MVVPTLNEGERLRRTVEQLLDTLPVGGEVVVVDDGSTDGSAEGLAALGVRTLRTERLGVTGARNFGGAHARGQVLVFADAHVDVPTDWWPPLAEELARPRVGAVAPAITVMGAPDSKGFGLRWASPAMDVSWLDQRGSRPYAVPLLPGAFLAVRRATFEAVGGFDPGLRVWGSEDAELSLRLWLLGYEQRLVPQVEVAHLFRERHPYQVDWSVVLQNLLRVALVHFKPGRAARVIEALKGNRSFAPAMARLVHDDLAARRADLERARVRDDDWFFDSFGMDL